VKFIITFCFCSLINGMFSHDVVTFFIRHVGYFTHIKRLDGKFCA
jgi:hypothetical protein